MISFRAGIHAAGCVITGGALAATVNHGYLEARAYPRLPSSKPRTVHAVGGHSPAPNRRTRSAPRLIEQSPRVNRDVPSHCLLLTGHGHFDLAAYDNYLSGKLQDFEHRTRRLPRHAESAAVGLVSRGT